MATIIKRKQSGRHDGPTNPKWMGDLAKWFDGLHPSYQQSVVQGVSSAILLAVVLIWNFVI